ncbi:Zinc finger protein 366 [Araneus ventricosus]|uniref:Zinc finger protein 366 n=1 Tax=Araneus ventricosus TaxID=182803 RepID=A0A4Y2LZL2_ARAVE|nr:Zinc finger protein 366 [Araneus ventricosus]
MGKKKKWNRPLCDNTNQCFPQGEFCINVEHPDSNNFQAFEPRLGVTVPNWSRPAIQSQLRCEICERVFQYPSQLRDHMLIHTRVRRFVCQVCGMKFMKEHHLKAHQATHSSVKPFACPICGRTFTLKANMERHTYIHNTERRFTCEQCGKKFSQPQTLKMHMISHSDVKPFACNICGKGLSRAHNLRAHMAIHRNNKPFKCHLCNSSFTLKGNMQRHLKEKHGVTEAEIPQHQEPAPSLSSESFILSLDPADAVGSPTGSRISEEDMSQNCNHNQAADLPQNNKRRKNPPKRVKCETPNSEHENISKSSPNDQDPHRQPEYQGVPASTVNNVMPAPNNFQQVQSNTLVPVNNSFPSSSQLQLCNPPLNVGNPSDHKPFTPCALPLQASLGHSSFGPVSVASFLPRPPGFYADSGMLTVPPNPFPNENVESKLQTIHSAIDDLAGKLSSPHEKVMAIHEALDELIHLRPENPANNFRCVKNERMGN